MSSAGVGLGTTARRGGFEESGRTHLALGLGGASCMNVLAGRARDLLSDAGAGVCLGAAARCGGFKESRRTQFALGLGGSGAGCLGVFARRTLGVGRAPLFGTIV